MKLFKHFMQPSKTTSILGCRFAALVSIWIVFFAPAVFGQMIIFQEDFESGRGNWIPDSCWQFGVPTVGPDSAHSGKNVVGTYLNGNYLPNLRCRLISPEITLGSLQTGENHLLKFWHWYSFGSNDFGQLQISVNGGTWQALPNLQFDDISAVWTQHVLDLSAYQNSTIRVGFYFATDGNSSVSTGWYIDDISVVKDFYTFSNPDDFELGVRNWSADNGQWEIGGPSVGPSSAHSGQNVAGTVLNGNYPANANSRLISPEITLTPVPGESPSISWQHWYSFSSSDAGYLQICVNGGNWQTLFGPITGQSNGWVPSAPISLAAYENATLRFAFYFVSDGNSSVSAGWYVDDIFIKGLVTCGFAISPTSQTFPASGGMGSVNVALVSGSNCSWTAKSNANWIMITSDSVGTGNGVVSYLVKANPSANSREGKILIAGDTVTVKQLSPGVRIFPVTDSTQFANEEFWVDVKVGDSANPVTNLFGVSFCLTFTNTDFIDVVLPHDSAVTPGNFLGNDVVFEYKVDEVAGKVCIGISKKTGQPGMSGSGTLARIKFIARPNIPDFTQAKFCLTEVVANDPGGNPLLLIPDCDTTTIRTCVTVWPGDTNNDRIVNQADVLPIGLYWGKTGPTCSIPLSCEWKARCCPPWDPVTATYADANGDGKVDQADILCLGLNWNKTHSTNFTAISNGKLAKLGSATSASLVPEVKPVQAPDQEFLVRVKASEGSNLFGLSFELLYSPRSFLKSITAEADSMLGNDVVFYASVDTAAGKVAVGISRKAGQVGVTGTGYVVRIKTTISSKAPNGTTIQFSLQNVAANDANGVPIQFALGSSSTTVLRTTADSENVTLLPSEYGLDQNYPNPFNPSTTIIYDLPRAGEVEIVIFNLLGERIRTLVKQRQAAGQHGLQWDGLDESGKPMPSGVYLYRLRAGEFAQTRKMVLAQ